VDLSIKFLWLGVVFLDFSFEMTIHRNKSYVSRLSLAFGRRRCRLFNFRHLYFSFFSSSLWRLDGSGTSCTDTLLNHIKSRWSRSIQPMAPAVVVVGGCMAS
jgi:hypothetical protein